MNSQSNQYQQVFGKQTHCTPIQCRNGPLEQERRCTDIFCCLLYLILLAAIVAFAYFSFGAMKLPHSQLQQELKKSQYGSPFIALNSSYFQIILGLACVMAICLLMLVVTFILPEIVTYIFLPQALVMTAVIGSAFLYVYFGNTLPFLSQQNQAKFIQQKSFLALGLGVLLLVAFIFILFIVINKRLRLSKIVNVLKIARVFIWENCYIIIISFLLSLISLILWYINIFLLCISQDIKDSQHIIDSRIMTLIIIVEILWTHGIMEGLSDFLFEAWAINWYFNKAKYGQGYSRIGKNCMPSFGLLCKHFGTIVFGWILAYIPQEINMIMRRCEQNCGCCYGFCCFCHKITLRKLSKYGYCQTILQSLSFCQANQQMYELKKRTKNTLPELYNEGNFFMTICKTFILMTSMIVVYFLLIQKNESFYFQNVANLIVPLLVTLFASSQICNHFLNATGLVGDTIVFMYTADVEIQKRHYGESNPHSCPEQVAEIIRRSRNSDIYQY